jgi:hypothetical protein
MGTAMADDLLPCPLCGRVIAEAEFNGEFWQVTCDMADHAVDAYGNTRERAVAKWNKRSIIFEVPKLSPQTV